VSICLCPAFGVIMLLLPMLVVRKARLRIGSGVQLVLCVRAALVFALCVVIAIVPPCCVTFVWSWQVVIL
jgi:hypothetical protein